MKYYTGVGSRKTPPGIIKIIEELAIQLRDKGFTLRSGHAPGADLAFETGANGQADIYLPWNNFNVEFPVIGQQCVKNNVNASIVLETVLKKHLDTQHFQNICKGKHWIKLLHTRNVYQVLGHEQTPFPSDFLVCWAPPSGKLQVQGGTNTAVLVAYEYKVPIYNLFYETREKTLREKIEQL